MHSWRPRWFMAVCAGLALAGAAIAALVVRTQDTPASSQAPTGNRVQKSPVQAGRCALRQALSVPAARAGATRRRT
jgi:hypothetical protein